MNMGVTNCLWDILESEANETFFINDAEKPAFLLLSKWNPLSHGGFELYMSHVSILCRVKTKKEALLKLDKMLETAKIPMKIWKESKRGFKTKRTLYKKVGFIVEKGESEDKKEL